MTTTGGFEIPTYPYDRLEPIEAIAKAVPGGMVDLSIGTPCDPPPAFVVAALSQTDAERGYPTVASTAPLVDAVRGLIDRQVDAGFAPPAQSGGGLLKGQGLGFSGQAHGMGARGEISTLARRAPSTKPPLDIREARRHLALAFFCRAQFSLR